MSIRSRVFWVIQQKKFRLFYPALILFLSFAWSPAVLAARLAKVNSDQVRVYETPDPDSTVVETLPQNEQVTTSNVPNSDYYKVRTSSGKIGWVESKSLNFQSLLSDVPPPASANLPPARSSPPKSSRPHDQLPLEMNAYSSLVPRKGEVKDSKEKDSGYFFQMSALFGATFFSASGIVNNFNNLGPGYSFGGETKLHLSRKLSMGLRVESIFKNLALTDSGSGKSFLMSLSSLPVMAGMGLKFIENSRISVGLDIFGGMALSTQLSSTDNSDSSPPPTVATLSSQAFTGLAKFEMRYQFARPLSIMFEGGYRLLQTSSQVSPTNNNGALVLQPSFPINLSGVFVGVGVGLSL